MHFTERDRFFTRVGEILASYALDPNPKQLEAWWMTCKEFDYEAVIRAMDSHANDDDAGKRAPRPVDIRRRISGGGTSTQCAFTGCTYPGTRSDATNGGGPWHCPWHFTNRSGSTADQYAEQSQRIPFAEAIALRAARIHDDSLRSPAVIETKQRMTSRAPTRQPGDDEAGEEHAATGNSMAAGG